MVRACSPFCAGTAGRATAIPGSNCHQNCHQNCQQNQTYSALSEASIGTEAEASLLGEGSVIRLPSQQARSVDGMLSFEGVQRMPMSKQILACIAQCERCSFVRPFPAVFALYSCTQL